ncbi:hypothetical protein A3C52_01405 [Candidatus Peribacteria bacterium RIFCSPHIGHO2_02_FULL_51_15]|nr:MAG: hypothetical protein A3C52_01405 [Candidatus Peribacteria bacterium RIFCSPHIGHO2_02_FULL_51_15]
MATRSQLAKTAADHLNIGGTPPKELADHPGMRYVDLLDLEGVRAFLRRTYDGVDGLDLFGAERLQKVPMVHDLALCYVDDLELLVREGKLPPEFDGQREKYKKILEPEGAVDKKHE